MNKDNHERQTTEKTESKGKQVPMTFEDLIPLVGTPVHVTGNTELYIPLMIREVDEDWHQWFDGECWVPFENFHRFVTRLDGTKFLKEVELPK